jgi:hypothetical protein
VPASVVPVRASEVVPPVAFEHAANASTPTNAVAMTPFLISCLQSDVKIAVD